jgi:hypothetical protein
MLPASSEVTARIESNYANHCLAPHDTTTPVQPYIDTSLTAGAASASNGIYLRIVQKQGFQTTHVHLPQRRYIGQLL